MRNIPITELKCLRSGPVPSLRLFGYRSFLSQRPQMRTVAAVPTWGGYVFAGGSRPPRSQPKLGYEGCGSGGEGSGLSVFGSRDAPLFKFSKPPRTSPRCRHPLIVSTDRL